MRLGQFWGVLGDLTRKIVQIIDLMRKVCTSGGDMRFEILFVKIGAAIFSVGLFK